MKNKTATECWNILRGELDSAIDSYVPMKKQGKRSKKKHLSKEAFRKIRHKQNVSTAVRINPKSGFEFRARSVQSFVAH